MITADCIRCHQEPRMRARLIGHECHKAQQRAINRDYTRRKRNSRLDRDSCNCHTPGCNGLTCDFVRVA